MVTSYKDFQITAVFFALQVKFASKLKVTNMTKDTFLNTIGSSELISDGQFKAWAFDFMNSPTVKKDVSRFALSPLKIHQTTIGQCITRFDVYRNN